MNGRIACTLLAATCAAAPPAAAQYTALLGGKVARFKDRDGSNRDLAVVKFARDPALEAVPPPCAGGASTAVRFRTDATDSGEIVLPCAGWQQRGRGWRYRDRNGTAGGIQKVVLRPGSLLIKAKGPAYPTITGPIRFVEVAFRVGGTAYCGRFDGIFRKNTPASVKLRGPSVPCTPPPTPTPLPLSCSPGFVCAAFAVLPGPGGLVVADGPSFSWFKLTDIVGFGVNNGSNGAFDPGPVVLARAQGADAGGRSELRIEEPVFIGAPRPSGGGGGKTCWKIEQDPAASGWIDCDGGSPAGAELSVDSDGAAPAAGPPSLSVATGTDGGPGAAVLRAIVRVAEAADAGADCSQQDYSASPVTTTAFVTGQASSTVLNTRQHVEDPGRFPDPDAVVTLDGTAFDCANWGSSAAAAAAVAAPLHALDVVPGVLPGTFDMAQVLRFQLGPLDSGAPGPQCGDGAVEPGEACDDGNGAPGDGCSAACTVEDGWQCSGSPSQCVPIACGNGLVQPGEACDDGNGTPGDGCSAACTVEDGFTCSGEPSACTPIHQLCPPGTTCAAFNIVPGPDNGLTGLPGTVDTFFQLFDFVGITSSGAMHVTDGNWRPGPILLAKGEEDPAGTAPLTWIGTTFIGAKLNADIQGFGSFGKVCIRIRQDPGATGWLSCGGGVSPDVSLGVDSRFAGPDGAPVLDVPAAADPAAPPGSAVIRVRTRLVLVSGSGPADDPDCSTVDYSGAPDIPTAWTTRLATSEVLQPLVVDALGQPVPGTDQRLDTLTGLPFRCADFGHATAPNVSLVLPEHALGFPAPIVNAPIDVAMALRLELSPASFPTGGETPTATGTPTPTPTPTSTAAPPTPTPTPTPTFAPTATRTSTPSPTPTRTPAPTFTPGPVLSNLILRNHSVDFLDGIAVPNCDRQAKTRVTLLSADAQSFATRFAQSVATDCETVFTFTPNPYEASQAAAYEVDFDVNCPLGAPYTITVTSSLNGALTIDRDNYDGCDLPFFGNTGPSVAELGAIAGSHTGGVLQSGSLGIPAPAPLNSASDANRPFSASSVATITGTGTGSPLPHSLSFTWSARCSSFGDATDTGAECAVRLGLESDIAPNGISACMGADDYPGAGGRDRNLDGHFLSVSVSCGAGFTPTPSPTPTPTVAATTTPAVTGTPTPTFTATPQTTPLGTLAFSVATGPGNPGALSPGCPSDDGRSSFLKTHGNPTGGFAGTVCNGTEGDFYSVGGDLQLFAGAPGANGVADLTIVTPVVIGASLPASTPDCGSCDVCWRIEQDAGAGFVDCDGGSAADVFLQIDSNGSNPPPAPGSGPYLLQGADAGPGTAVVVARVKRMRRSGTCPGPDDTAWSGIPEDPVLLTTATAISRIDDRRQCSGNTFGTACPSDDPYMVVLGGQPFDCANWSAFHGGSLVVPFHNLDEPIGGNFGPGDIAQVLRIAD